MTEDDKHLIRSFIAAHVGEDSLDDDVDLFANGHATSLFAVQLVMWVEETFGLVAEGEDLDFANFSSVDAVAAFVDGKRATVGGGPWTSR
ncbi:phosphopantetheine-binding protein [Streptomyces sp. NPDC050703]|uniref:acyl carrier protein n=1 Tax=Streptomyces sp. NPDC050703 TaxID=3157218 RepID=UPI0034247BB2